MLRFLNHYISLRRLILCSVESLIILLCLQGILSSLYSSASFSNRLHLVILLILSPLVYEIFLYWFDLYGCQEVHRNRRGMAKLGLALLIASLTLYPFYPAGTRRPFPLEMLLIPLNSLVVMGVVVGVRWMLPVLLNRAPWLKHTILILGSDTSVALLTREIQMNQGSGIQVAGIVVPEASLKGD